MGKTALAVGVALALAFFLGAAAPASAEWKAKVQETQGGFNALVENVNDDGQVTETRTAGKHKNKRQANRAAKKLANELNDQSVVADPNCDEAGVKC